MKTLVQHHSTVATAGWLRQKVTDYNQLIKTRLTLLVVFSAAITYLTASGMQNINWFDLFMLSFGGFLVVAASNGLNQIIEKNYDRLMIRTANRPVATKRMQVQEAAFASMLMGITGVLLMGIFLNQLTSLLALVSLILYAFVYTPMKRVSPVSVFVGAFPGALPVLLGWTAFSGNITSEGIILFGVQFFWQFPHFWSIAWILDEDYKRAGFKMLPSYGKDKKTAMQTLMFTLMLIPMGFLPAQEGFVGITSGLIAIAAGVCLSWFAFRLFVTCDNREAKRLMFASFLYLPLVQIAYLIDKL